MFLEYITLWLKENEQLINEMQLKIDHVISHGSRKIELGMSNVITNDGGSFELLDDGTCDMMIIDYEKNDSAFFDTVYLKDVNELKYILNSFVKRLATRSA